MNLIIEISPKISANNVINFAVNNLRTIYSDFRVSKDAVRKHFSKSLKPFYEHLKYAVTLTMKKTAIIAHKHSLHKHKAYLNESIAIDQLRYFAKRLQHYAYGADAKRVSTRDSCAPIVIPALEGGRSGLDKDKRLHWHLAIGNLPNMSLAEANEMIMRAWKDCDFSYDINLVRNIYEVNGWINYMTKGMLFGDTNVIELDLVMYPKSFEISEVMYLQLNENWSALELSYSK